jgi:hypothetical protein
MAKKAAASQKSKAPKNGAAKGTKKMPPWLGEAKGGNGNMAPPFTKKATTKKKAAKK